VKCTDVLRGVFMCRAKVRCLEMPTQVEKFQHHRKYFHEAEHHLYGHRC